MDNLIFYQSNHFIKLIKYYEKTKSSYARDIDHLVTFNKNGLWIKENFKDLERIVTATRLEGDIIYEVKIFELNKDFNLNKKIIAQKANIKSNEWELVNTKVFNFDGNILKEDANKNYTISSIYNSDKLKNLFNNSDTFSF